MRCPHCGGEGRRLNPELVTNPTLNGLQVLNPRGLPLLVPCTECIGGIASCCDAAGSAQVSPPLGRADETEPP